MIRAGAASAILLALAGCGSAPQNYPLTTGQPNPPVSPYRATAGQPFVAMSFSGGGSRAAVLAASVTRLLEGLTYSTPSGETRRLDGDIAAISSVSGGSLYAGYVGIYGVNQIDHRPVDFENFVQNFNGIGLLVGSALNPFTWLGLAAQNTTRIDVLEDMIALALGPDGKTPSTATLADIERPGAPTVLLNASDMVSGQVFTFDKDTMDDLCLSTAAVPVSVAVTASAAFPVAFTPVLLRNNSLDLNGNKIGTAHTDACARPPPGDWINNLDSQSAPYTDLETYRHVVARAEWRGEPAANGMKPRRTPVFIRLADGGVVDNLGLTALRRALLQQGSPIDLTPILAALPPDAPVLRLVTIVINARNDTATKLDKSPEYTDLLDMADLDSSALVGSASAQSGHIFDNFVAELQRSLRASFMAGRVVIYPIEIDADRLPDVPGGGPYVGRNLIDRVNQIATSWTLQPGDSEALDAAALTLLARDPCYARLYADMGLSGGPAPAPVAGTVCNTANPSGRLVSAN